MKKKVNSNLLIIIVIIFVLLTIGSMFIGLIRHGYIETNNSNYLKATPTTSEIETEYFSSLEECQVKTYSTCKCMLTNVNTSQCVGWTE